MYRKWDDTDRVVAAIEDALAERIG